MSGQEENVIWDKVAPRPGVGEVYRSVAWMGKEGGQDQAPPRVRDV